MKKSISFQHIISALQNNRLMLWYMLCFLLLGLIDQRRGSAVGEVQMIYANLSGLVILGILLPGMQLREFFQQKIYRVWLPICAVLSALAIYLRPKDIGGIYAGQWNTAVLNVSFWSFVVIYLFCHRKDEDIMLVKKLRRPLFWTLAVMCVFMQISVHEGSLGLWLLLVFGCFYLIGIPGTNKKQFYNGLLNGIILWFFIQQIWAFGFRPYDYVRYRGAYSGETQNGLFYMIVFCAFLLKWHFHASKGQKVRSALTFLLAAGCVGFTIMTGGRSPLVGEVLATLVVLTYHYLRERRSFYRWFLRGTALLLTSLVLLPAVYGCVRYLPTILHHPVWFEGEFSEGGSVRSYDPWNSEKYVSFDKMMQQNFGRLWKGLVVHATEATNVDPGSNPENPYHAGDVVLGAIETRLSIYQYFIEHLNFQGHQRDDGMYYYSWRFYGHPHNMFIEQTYNYGFISGFLFLTLYLYALVKNIQLRKEETLMQSVFLIAIMGFGMFESVMVQGQITLVLMYMTFCLTMVTVYSHKIYS